MKSVFISYKFEDLKYKNKVQKWAKAKRLGDNIVITGESQDVRSDGPNAVKKHINPKIKGAAVVIVLIGQDTHNANGVIDEINSAISQRKPIIPIKIQHTTGKLPNAIKDKTPIVLHPDAIKNALNSI